MEGSSVEMVFWRKIKVTKDSCSVYLIRCLTSEQNFCLVLALDQKKVQSVAGFSNLTWLTHALLWQGTLNWTRVPRDVTIQNITVPDEKIYQFAISANTENESSGMVWASCTVIHNRSEYTHGRVVRRSVRRVHDSTLGGFLPTWRNILCILI